MMKKKFTKEENVEECLPWKRITIIKNFTDLENLHTDPS